MKILHLYYDLMNLYGEYGNVVVLKKHLLDQGVEVTVEQKTIGDSIDFKQYDFIYCGSGSEKNQLVALNDLIKKKDNFTSAINSGSIILFTGNAMELLGESVDKHKALSIVPIKTTLSDKRYTGDVIVKNDEIGEVVGFINKCSHIKESQDIKLFDYLFKDNNLEDNRYEGYNVSNIYGTHIIGPILVKNPCLMNYFVSKLLKKDLKDISYPYEEDSYQVTLKALKERMN